MSISDHGPVQASHTPPADHENPMFDTDAQLSEVVEQAFADRDFDTIREVLEEKLSIERALGSSRVETFNHRMDREFFGGGA